MIKVISVSDAGQDPDDEEAAVVLIGAARAGDVEVRLTVASLSPTTKRAQLILGTYQQLGYPNIPVAAGNNEQGKEDYQFNVPYMADPQDLCSGPWASCFRTVLNGADDKSVTVLAISGLYELRAFFNYVPELFTQKVRNVVIMGGVKTNKRGDACRSNHGYLKPDMTAYNHLCNRTATTHIYKNLQTFGIPITAVGRWAPYTTMVPTSFYEKLNTMDSLVAKRLYRVRYESVHHLWRICQLPVGHPDRGRLPDRWNKEQFCNRFLGGRGKNRGPTDTIWDIVTGFALYDPIAALACIPEATQELFNPNYYDVGGTTHSVIGLSEAVHGIKNPKALSQFLQDFIIQTLNKEI